MIYRIFAIRDDKMNLFMMPMFLNSRGQAQRVVADEVNRPTSGSNEPPTVLQLHPEDTALYEIGEYDNESGLINRSDSPVLIVRCKDLLVGRS